MNLIHSFDFIACIRPFSVAIYAYCSCNSDSRW
jgi:hypothetical protein